MSNEKKYQWNISDTWGGKQYHTHYKRRRQENQKPDCISPTKNFLLFSSWFKNPFYSWSNNHFTFDSCLSSLFIVFKFFTSFFFFSCIFLSTTAPTLVFLLPLIIKHGCRAQLRLVCFFFFPLSLLVIQKSSNNQWWT